MNALLHGCLYGLPIITVILTMTAIGLWFERKLAARIHTRKGPTMVGPAGILQPIADVLKMLQKEHITPAKADRVLFNLAPILVGAFAVASAAVVPFSPSVVAADLDVGVLYVLAVNALILIPVWMGGWSSNNKFALIGAMRAVAQSVSYSVPMVLSALVPVILAGSLSLSDIVRYQVDHHWIATWPTIPGFPAFILFFLSSLAEANRIPFDIPEAESELIAGVTTEYTGMKFGLFYMAEYIHTLIASAVAAALFLGGWDGPVYPGLHWMVLKTLLLFASIYWLRWSLLRFRSDQLMTLCWKWLVPASLFLVMAAAGIAQWTQSGGR